MNILWLTIPVSLLLGIGFILSFIWATGDDQWGDLDTPAQRMLQDQDVHPDFRSEHKVKGPRS
ncbi:MAG: cbb3-type cytochrome oxidase assembly protein CcoS [Bdellovibrionaceae bacterium]|nr:cbb3-type cytochrome oxidase assembly protein CcoS [Pseudobdellovibrionaceae bacterium]